MQVFKHIHCSKCRKKYLLGVRVGGYDKDGDSVTAIMKNIYFSMVPEGITKRRARTDEIEQEMVAEEKKGSQLFWGTASLLAATD